MEGQGTYGSGGAQPQTPPGWYPDPQGRGQRYWDGNRWTEHVSGVDAPPPGSYGPQTKRRGGIVWKVALGIVLGFCLLIGGCVALLGAGVNQAQKDQDKHAITAQQFHHVHRGSARSEVINQLGVQPGDAQSFENQGLPGHAVKSSCIYYNEKGKALGEGSFFQFCFDGGKLTSKNAY